MEVRYTKQDDQAVNAVGYGVCHLSINLLKVIVLISTVCTSLWWVLLKLYLQRYVHITRETTPRLSSSTLLCYSPLLSTTEQISTDNRSSRTHNSNRSCCCIQIRIGLVFAQLPVVVVVSSTLMLSCHRSGERAAR